MTLVCVTKQDFYRIVFLVHVHIEPGEAREKRVNLTVNCTFMSL